MSTVPADCLRFFYIQEETSSTLDEVPVLVGTYLLDQAHKDSGAIELCDSLPV